MLAVIGVVTGGALIAFLGLWGCVIGMIRASEPGLSSVWITAWGAFAFCSVFITAGVITLAVQSTF